MARAVPQHRKERSPTFAGRLLAALPGALLVIDPEGTVLRAYGELSRVASATPSELVGSRLVEHVTEDSWQAASELVRTTATSSEGTAVGPVRLDYVAGDGARRTTEAWGVRRLADPEIRGLCLLLLSESAYDRLDGVLTTIVGGGSLNETLGALSQALRYPPVLAEAFFVLPGADDRGLLRVPDLPGVPGPPSPGPWDAVGGPGGTMVHERVAKLPRPLRQAAKAAGFTAVSAVPVPGLNGRQRGSLVLWWQAAEPPVAAVRAAIERATALASLAMSHEAAQAIEPSAAPRDPLTGLVDRDGFAKALEARIAAGEQPAVLCVDLDGLRAVNDSYGQLTGDAVLRVAARRLASVMRTTDELARLEADEFAVLCGGSVTSAQTASIARRIVDQLAKPLSLGDGQSVAVGGSVGIAIASQASSPETVLGLAGRALRQAKSRGSGGVAFAGSGLSPAAR